MRHAWWHSRRRRVPPRSGDGPLTCAEVAALLQHYLDGRLDPATAQRAHDHLERCRDCGLEADAYEALKAALHEYGAPPADSIDRLAEFARRLAEGDVPEPSG